MTEAARPSADRQAIRCEGSEPKPGPRPSPAPQATRLSVRPLRGPLLLHQARRCSVSTGFIHKL